MQKFIILGFDMETDIGSYLKSYRGVAEGTPLLAEILRRYSVPATFFFTGDTASRNPALVRELAAAGYDIGCHSLRHETVGDAHFDMPGDSPILEEEVGHRLELNLRIVEELAGLRPVSFRAPRLWQGQAQLQALERLGFLADASYSVFAHRKQTLPYHPSRTDWREAGDLGILEIPNFAFDPSTHDYERYFCKNDQWPLLRLLGAKFVFPRLGELVRRQAQSSGTCVLQFYLHPWEFQPMPSRHTYSEGTMNFREELHKNCGKRMVAEFTRLLELALEDGFRFASCRQFVPIWEGRRETAGGSP